MLLGGAAILPLGVSAALSVLLEARSVVRVISTGVDIVEIHRIAELLARHGDRFRRRVYTDREWADSGGRVESLAARFAAKEALIKALGSREPALREIEVVRPALSQPSLRLWGRAAEIARGLAVRQLSVSLSHGEAYAVAMVVVVRDGESPAWDAELDEPHGS